MKKALGTILVLLLSVTFAIPIAAEGVNINDEINNAVRQASVYYSKSGPIDEWFEPQLYQSIKRLVDGMMKLPEVVGFEEISFKNGIFTIKRINNYKNPDLYVLIDDPNEEDYMLRDDVYMYWNNFLYRKIEPDELMKLPSVGSNDVVAISYGNEIHRIFLKYPTDCEQVDCCGEHTWSIWKKMNWGFWRTCFYCNENEQILLDDINETNYQDYVWKYEDFFFGRVE